LSAENLESLWKEVTGEDGLQAHRAMWTMISAPEATVTFLKNFLQPVPSVDARQIAKLIANLDSDNFVARERAMTELEKITDLAETALRKVLDGQPTPEVQNRVSRLLEQVQGTIHSRQRLGQIRGLEILVQIGTPQALEVMKALAAGAPDASLTKQAKADWERLQRLDGH
jgi:DNA-binding phage protein